MKKITFLFLVAHLVPFLLFTQTSADDMVARMGRGINLGNVLSAPTEGDWSPIVMQQYFKDVAAAGFTNVRIPIDFYGTRTTPITSSYDSASGTSASYSGSSADYTVNTSYLDRIEDVIDWSLAEGLVTILDFHGSELKSEFIYTFDDGESEHTHETSAKRAADNDKFRAIWTQVADRFKIKSENLLFEIINEPYFHMSAADMNTLNADILTIIRGTGGNNSTRNVIITGGGQASHEAPLQIASSVIDNDAASGDYLIATFHYYQPFQFTSSSADLRDNYSWGSVDDKNLITTRFDEVSTWAASNNIPVFVGEFGADNTGGYNYSTGDLNAISNNATGFADGGPDNVSKVEYYRYVAELAISKGFSFSVWDSGPKSNKTIHKRTDNPSTVNYNRSNFSVTTYEPKETTVSTILDTSVWVEDVKNALINPVPNPTFTSGVSWLGNAAGACTGAEIGAYDSSITNTADGSGSWKINACNDDANRLELQTAVSVNSVNYTLTFYVRGTADQVIRPIINNSIEKQSYEGNYTIAATDVWEKVVRTWDNIVAGDAILHINLMTINTSVNIDDVSLVKNPASLTAISSAITGDWNLSGSWTGGVVPTSLDDVIIADGHVIKVVSAVAVNNLTINGTGKLIINSGKSLFIGNDLINNNSTTSGNNSIRFNAGDSGPAALKIGGSYTGSDIKFNYRMPENFNNKWRLIAAPLKGATINNYINNSQTIVENSGGDKWALGPYDDSLDSDLKYMYVDKPYTNASALFISGKGYATKLNDNGSPVRPTLTFVGKIQDAASVSLSISSAGDGFNLVGNPYSSWLFANSPAYAVNNLLTANESILNEATIWLWDTNNQTYITKNQGSAAFRIAPTQGFFVKAKTGGVYNFSFSENMQTITTDANYRTSNTRFEINLFIVTNYDQRNTTVRYNNNRTTSFDNGYDSSLFGGDDLSIYTELVENNTGKKLAIQSLPNSNFENMVIPVGVMLAEGSDITFTADALNIPANYKVYLEDRVTNIVTRLDEANSEYVVFIESGNTNGRFYLHAKTSAALITDTNNLSTISMFTTSNSNLRVQGLHEGDGSILIFNILGKEMFKTSFEGNGANDITLPNLANGIYIIKLVSQNGTINKKIIIQ
ncbi:cellulase family glycosylhydrolase [Flavobacteriaceae bacterium]|nr:cellulase family glycosylhydrolase [Flavobacteriaceae bacterium]